MPSCMGCGGKFTERWPCTCPEPCENCEGLEEKLRIATEALGFYADTENYNYDGAPEVTTQFEDGAGEKREDTDTDVGEKARTALRKIREGE